MARILAAGLAALLLALAGCGHVRSVGSAPVAVVESPSTNDWHQVVSEVDEAQIGRLSADWDAALAIVRQRGGVKALTAEGPLLESAAALPRPAPPPGVYHCRLIRLGLPGYRGNGLAAFKPFYCYIAVEGPLLTFTKGTGTHRPGGRLWDDGDKRLIFLGGVSARPDGPLPAYGADPASNQIGVVERIGDFRWRMVVPGIEGQSKLDVLELLPDAPVPKP